MNNRKLKRIKFIVLFAMIPIPFTMSCIPIGGMPGLPALLTTVSPTANPRVPLCNLLLDVGGTEADVATCLTASSINDKDLNRLCQASAGLTDAQKETLKEGLKNQGVNADTCLTNPNSPGEPLPVGTINSPLPNPSTPPTDVTSSPSVAVTPSNAPIIELSPTPVASSHSTSDGSSSSEPPPDNVPLEVIISEPSAIPSGISAE